MKDADGKWIGYGLGDTLPMVRTIQRRLIYAYPRYSRAIQHGVTESGVYDDATRLAVTDLAMHINMTQQKKLRTDGVADWRVLVTIGAVTAAPTAPTKRFIQQGVGFDTSAFLMGNPTHSYVDAITEGSAELLRLALPDLRPKVVIGYSMGDDAANHAMLRWPADRRDEIALYVGFGSPSRPEGPTLLGNDPGGKGIASVHTPDWLRDRAYHFTHEGDMYANAVGVLPQLYQILVRLEVSIEFAAYLFNVFATTVGRQLLGVAAAQVPGAGALAALRGLVTPGRVTTTTGDIDLTAILANLPAIVQTIAAALKFVHTNAHFRYHDMPRPFWRDMTAVDCAAQIITEKVPNAVVYTLPGTVDFWNNGPPAWTAWKLP
jgi:hypothetical protein